MNETSQSCFEFNIFKALLNILNSITDVRSAGGLQWIFALLLKVTSKNTQYVATKCITLLNKLAEDLNNKSNPYHLLLRCRYGLYGTPLELELFDLESPPYPKCSSNTYVTYAAAVTGGADAFNSSQESFENCPFSKESLNPKDVISGANTKLKWKTLVPPKVYKGLIETEPLHFTCISGSEGTRLENADTSTYGMIHDTPFSMTPYNITQQNNTSHIIFESAMDDPYGDLETLKNFKPDISSVLKTQQNKPQEQQQQPSTSGTVTWDNQENSFVFISGIPVDVGNDLLKKLGEPQKKLMYLLSDTEISDSMYQNFKTLETKNSSTKSIWQLESLLAPSNSSALPWQHLLLTPPHQVVVVERMHSGARRYVVLDFGHPVLLTDVLIPACNDVVSVTLDVWLTSEDADGTRLVVAMDIGTRNLVLNDLQPPPLCRYIKVCFFFLIRMLVYSLFFLRVI